MITWMKKHLKFLYKDFLFWYSTKAFQKRYKHVDKELFKQTLPTNVLKKYKERWNVFGKKVETDTFLLCYNLSGKINYDIIPENIFAAIIEKTLNPYRELSFFASKNVYEKWFDNGNLFPTTYFHRMDGVYYDKEYNILNDILSFINSNKIIYPLIAKPSRETAGGRGVKKILNKEELLEYINMDRDVIAQELIEQNEYLNKINPGINSIRTCVYRTSTGSFKVLNNTIRFGIHGGLDNATAGGIACNINDDGKLNHYALNKYAIQYFEHPNSHIKFSDIEIPHYKELNEIVETITNQVPWGNVLSIDMCLDINNTWRCLEINTMGNTIRFAQYAGKSFFGEYTDEAINTVLKKWKV